MPKKETKKDPPVLVRHRIRWKDPDAPRELRKFGACGEYFIAEIEIGPKSGVGVIRLKKESM